MTEGRSGEEKERKDDHLHCDYVATRDMLNCLAHRLVLLQDWRGAVKLYQVAYHFALMAQATLPESADKRHKDRLNCSVESLGYLQRGDSQETAMHFIWNVVFENDLALKEKFVEIDDFLRAAHSAMGGSGGSDEAPD